MGALISGMMQAGGNVVRIIRTDPAKAARQAADAVIAEVNAGRSAVQAAAPGAATEGRKNAPAGAEAESTAINTDPMQHTPSEQAIIEEYQQGTDEVLKDTFESYFDNPKQAFSRHNISNVSERQASDAGKLLGGEYKGYKNAINSNGIRHILNEHGPNGSVDNSLSDMNDIARMGYVIDNYDAVEVVTYQSGDADLSREFRTQDNKPAPMLKYSKKVNGTYYVVEAIPESKYKKFWVVSAYMQKADSGTQAPDANGPENTPKASLASSLPVSNTNVPHRVPGVNGQYMHNAPSVFLPGSGLEGTWTAEDGMLPVDEKLAQTSRWLLPVDEKLAQTSRWLLPLDEKLAERSMLPLSEAARQARQTAVENRAAGEYTGGEKGGHGPIGEGKSVTASEGKTQPGPYGIIEFDADGNPIYALTKKEANIQPTDLRADQKRRAEVAKQLGLERDEASRLEDYVRGYLCYQLNRKMTKDLPLTDGEKRIVESIQNALKKFPEYSGRTYRNRIFKTEEDCNAFLEEHNEGNTVTLKGFSSTSKRPNGYPLFGPGVVHLVIDGVSGRDIADTYGVPRQQEVTYLPNVRMKVTRVTQANDKHPLIYLQEVIASENDSGENGRDSGNQ